MDGFFAVDFGLFGGNFVGFCFGIFSHIGELLYPMMEVRMVVREGWDDNIFEAL